MRSLLLLPVLAERPLIIYRLPRAGYA